MDIPKPGQWQYRRTLTIPDCAAAHIRAERARDNRGELDPLDSHAAYCREKLAYGLAVLDGRVDMTVEDWELAGVAEAVSRHTRSWVASQLEAARTEQAEQAGQLHGVMREAADSEKAAAFDARVDRMVGWLEDKLMAAPGGRMRGSDLFMAANSRDRAALRHAVNLAVATKVITSVEDTSTNPPTLWWVVL